MCWQRGPPTVMFIALPRDNLPPHETTDEGRRRWRHQNAQEIRCPSYSTLGHLASCLDMFPYFAPERSGFRPQPRSVRSAYPQSEAFHRYRDVGRRQRFPSGWLRDKPGGKHGLQGASYRLVLGTVFAPARPRSSNHKCPT